MFALPRARRGGKTHEMVRLFMESHSLLLVPNQHMKYDIIKRYRIPKERHDHIVTPNECPDKLRGLDATRDVYVDDLDWVLREFVGRNVTGFSFTGHAR